MRLGCALEDRAELKRSLLILVVVGALAYASVASAVPTEIQVRSSTLRPVQPGGARPLLRRELPLAARAATPSRTTSARTSRSSTRAPSPAGRSTSRSRPRPAPTTTTAPCTALPIPAAAACTALSRSARCPPARPDRGAVHGQLGSVDNDHRQSVRRPLPRRHQRGLDAVEERCRGALGRLRPERPAGAGDRESHLPVPGPLPEVVSAEQAQRLVADPVGQHLSPHGKGLSPVAST